MWCVIFTLSYHFVLPHNTYALFERRAGGSNPQLSLLAPLAYYVLLLRVLVGLGIVVARGRSDIVVEEAARDNMVHVGTSAIRWPITRVLLGVGRGQDVSAGGLINSPVRFRLSRVC